MLFFEVKGVYYNKVKDFPRRTEVEYESIILVIGCIRIVCYSCKTYEALSGSHTFKLGDTQYTMTAEERARIGSLKCSLVQQD